MIDRIAKLISDRKVSYFNLGRDRGKFHVVIYVSPTKHVQDWGTDLPETIDRALAQLDVPNPRLLDSFEPAEKIYAPDHKSELSMEDLLG